VAWRKRKPEGTHLTSIRLARVTRRGFAESKWPMAMMPYNGASSKTVNDLAGHA
jgi:hypothetical protein